MGMNNTNGIYPNLQLASVISIIRLDWLKQCSGVGIVSSSHTIYLERSTRHVPDSSIVWHAMSQTVQSSGIVELEQRRNRLTLGAVSDGSLILILLGGGGKGVSNSAVTILLCICLGGKVMTRDDINSK